MGGGYPQSVAVSEAGDMGRRGQYASAPSPRNSLVQVSVAILFFFFLLRLFFPLCRNVLSRVQSFWLFHLFMFSVNSCYRLI